MLLPLNYIIIHLFSTSVADLLVTNPSIGVSDNQTIREIGEEKPDHILLTAKYGTQLKPDKIWIMLRDRTITNTPN